jgi:hypothetical protein
LGVLAHPSVATPAEKPAESATQRPDDGDQRDKDGFSTKFSAVRDWGPHWSLFNLTIVLVNLFSALGLIAHLGFTVLRKEKLEDETWERMGPPKTLSDVEKIAARYKSQAKGEESPVTPDEQSIVFRQFCTSACVGLALSGLIVFFIVEKLDTRMVMFDALSPLFVVLFVLTLFGGILALTSDRRKL